ncbi:hypothetical protein FBZ90_10935 [Nitrospirillum pindoramense]|uniref:Uncharacterized protein n=2 Tax=Nitrospirillum amazonense TaxID=28077 RepID=A0A560H298_9PROT|nr:hypothetical protein FBZ90_10935 [Nitrospirillum amazonense]
MNSFQIPPRVKLDDLILGARFFISGQKGCGKTALLLFVRNKLTENGANTNTVLFKTGISEAERAKLATGGDFEIIRIGNDISVQYDYTTNWLWFIYKNLLRLLNIDDVISNKEVADDLKRLIGVYNETRPTSFSDLSISKIKAAAKAGIKTGIFTGQINAEVQAIHDENDDRKPIEIIEIIEKYLCDVQLKTRKRCALFFDELELFWNRPDQRERDLFLIRDLLQSVARVNRALGAKSASFVVYASVRSEVLEEVNRVGPEIVRDINDFGVSVSWNVKGTSENQPILNIVSAKINNSEIENDEIPSDNVWDVYFNEKLHGKNIKDYLLDTSMFKPRNIINMLNLAKKYDPENSFFTKESFEETSIEFSQAVWREIEEELLGSYDSRKISNLKAILTGFSPSFTVIDLEARVQKLKKTDPSLANGFNTRPEIVDICRALYRVGAAGNFFNVKTESGLLRKRDRWSFRDMGEPTIDEKFIIHASLRKVFQIPN